MTLGLSEDVVLKRRSGWGEGGVGVMRSGRRFLGGCLLLLSNIIRQSSKFNFPTEGIDVSVYVKIA